MKAYMMHTRAGMVYTGFKQTVNHTDQKRQALAALEHARLRMLASLENSLHLQNLGLDHIANKSLRLSREALAAVIEANHHVKKI